MCREVRPTRGGLAAGTSTRYRVRAAQPGFTVAWPVFLAALGSALLHACWNMRAKRNATPHDVIFGIILATAGLCAAALPFAQSPPIAAWPWLGAASICNVVYSVILMEA